MIDGHTGVVPPGPFSNPEVKRALVDRGTGIFLGAAPTLSINLFLTKNVGEKVAAGLYRNLAIPHPPAGTGARQSTFFLQKTLTENWAIEDSPTPTRQMDNGAL